MNKTEHGRRHDGIWIGILAMLCAAAPPLHAETVPAAAPQTTAHFFSSRPMIAGTVVTVNDHQMVVDTDQGERITLQVSSRTMAPRDLAPGMTVRTEFAALENCKFHADRVIAVREGMSPSRQQAYANTHATRDNLAAQAAMNRTAGYRTAANESRPPGPRSNIMRAMPGTQDHHYSSRPLISGRVMSVTDHRVVVETDQGRNVALVMDSRTMVPREISPGSLLRAEFREMDDGRYYAQRIHLIGSEAEYREQAYANTVDNDFATAGTIGDCESIVPTPGTSATSASVASHAPTSGTGTTDHGATSDHMDHGATTQTTTDAEQDRVAANEAYDRDGTLPETASQRPLYLLLGLLALGSAGVVTFLRLRKA
jgi:hypothetical protein